MLTEIRDEVYSPVDSVLSQLIGADRQNRKLAPEVRNNSFTLSKGNDGLEMVVVNGSAHKMREAFIGLFKARPELRQVVQGVLNDMYRIADR